MSNIQELVDRIMMDTRFAECMAEEPITVLQRLGIEPNGELLNLLDGVSQQAVASITELINFGC